MTILMLQPVVVRRVKLFYLYFMLSICTFGLSRSPWYIRLNPLIRVRLKAVLLSLKIV